VYQAEVSTEKRLYKYLWPRGGISTIIVGMIGIYALSGLGIIALNVNITAIAAQ